MRYRFHKLLFSLILLFSFAQSYGQKETFISGSFEGFSFNQFVQAIESNSNYHFYYDQDELDSFTINIKANDLSLSEILTQIFEKTIFHYAIDSGNRVFISKRYLIQTSLSKEFFDEKNLSDTSNITKELISEDQPKQNDILKLSQENKLYDIGIKDNKPGAGKATVAGYIRNIKNGEVIIGASVYIDTPSIGVNTDQYGYYSLTLPKGRYVIKISSAGMKDTKRQIILYSDGKLNIELEDYIASLKTVIVSSERTSNTLSTQMGVNRLNIRSIKQMPVVFGEADVLKVVLTLPGVTSVGEASTGFNVRGGSTDQNLILFGDATIYNPTHLFGFFSSFNPDVVSGIELYKSAIPEKFGGRLSSVLDVSLRDGNTKKWTGTGGLGPLTSKFTIEGPIKKEKTSVIAAVRTTYSDWLLRSIPNITYNNSKADFSDANLHISHTINSKNSLFITGYVSYDRFNLNSDTTYKYSNRDVNIKWKHIFNNKFYGVLTTGFDHYQYSVSSSLIPVNAFRLGFDINQTNFHTDFIYSPNNKHIISYGLNSVFYKLHPGFFEPIETQSLVEKNVVPAEQALESALYLGDQYSVSSKFSINAGLRYSVFNYLGPHELNDYASGLPRDTTTIQKTLVYNKGKIIKTYQAPEIRLAARYTLSANTSLKFSYNTTQQYIHLLSNTTAISPTDIWKLSDPNIKPQQGQQISLGLYKNFKSNTIETSVEIYYKTIKNYLDYKSGANLVLNHHIETDVVNTKGKAYGIEFLLKKSSGKSNGWLSYTYSRTFLKLDDSLAGETINHGNYYPANFDKPHSINFVGNYRFSHRYSLSANIVYSMGRPITLPIAVFTVDGSPALLYSDRNQYRIPDYFRTDLSFNLEGNHKVKQVAHNSWSVGVYNLTGRQNAYSVYFIQENGKIKGYQLSIFGTLIPFITYNIKF